MKGNRMHEHDTTGSGTMKSMNDDAALCPITRLPMSKAEEFALAVDVLASSNATDADLVSRYERRIVDCVMRHRAAIIEALEFFERKEAIRAALAEIGSEVLATFDREALPVDRDPLSVRVAPLDDREAEYLAECEHEVASLARAENEVVS